MTSKAHASKNHSSLRIIAGILLFSAVIRFIGIADFANAQVGDVLDDIIPDESVEVLDIPFTEEAISELLEIFLEREARLIEREDELDRFSARLEQAREEISEKIDQLTDAEARLAKTLAIADTAAEEDLNRLAAVYQNMKPKDTAALFTEMSPDFAAGFLGLMQPEAAAAIMTELDPNIAHRVSIMLAGRNANAFNEQ